MSLPPLARWAYDYRPAPSTPEAEAWDYFRPQPWLESDWLISEKLKRSSENLDNYHRNGGGRGRAGSG